MRIDEILKVEELRAEVERLREADRLREIAFQAYAEQERKDRAEIEQLRAEIERLKAWHRHIARDPDTNFEAVAYARDALRGAPKP